jgi:hypothetical protein
MTEVNEQTKKPNQQFEECIFPLELEQIVQRQERTGKKLNHKLESRSKQRPSPIEFGADNDTQGKKITRYKGVSPSTDLELTGLALSGGGIRSATFNLGVVQALAERGIFQQVDYLSTVSGGGYFGGCLSSVFNKAIGGDTKPFPFGSNDRGQERKAVKHLRNNSNYLAPRGLLDLIRAPALLLRGILLHFLVLLPYLVLAIWLTDWVWGGSLREAAQVCKIKPEACEIKNYFHYAAIVAGIFVLWVVLSPFVQSVQSRFFPSSFKWRDRYERSFGFFLTLFLMATLLATVLTGLSAYHYYLHIAEPSTIKNIIKAIKDYPGWATLGAIVPFLFAGKAAENVSKLRGKLTLIVLGLLVPLILFAIYLSLAGGVVFQTKQSILGSISAPDWLHWPPYLWWALFTWLATLLFVDVNKTSLHSFYRDRLSKAYLIQVDDNDDNNYIDHNDTQKLSELNAAEARAPYHLINATLNLQGSGDPDLRRRDADFFLFSKYAVGSNRTGYCATEDLEKIDARLNLGTAMAISGAAAAPNMGSTTIKPLVVTMALLNVRLGYWLPSPRWVDDPRVPNPLFRMGAGPIYLLSEALSDLNEKLPFVNVSDGGHIENLGIYELLRRRCKFIIASDAEADTTMSFGGLATLIRHAYIDMGIEIKVELEEVRKNEAGLSRKKCALGKIRYPGGETGHLLYIKSSVSGGETEYIHEYRSRNTAFPHESTDDQFFDETQFEAYRALGYDSAKNLFQEQRPFDAAAADDPEKTAHQISVNEWFEELTSLLRPRFPMENKFIDLQNQLSTIERGFNDPDVAVYTYQIYPEIDPARRLKDTSFAKSLDPRVGVAGRADLSKHKGRTSEGKHIEEDERFRKIFHLCNLQMQLMENVFIGLELDKPQYRAHYFNRGWMNLFRRWSQAPYFRHAWAISIGTYSVGFQRFCKESLKLQSEVFWKQDIGCEYLTGREQQYLEQGNLRRFFYGEGHGTAPSEYQIWQARMCVTSTATPEDLDDWFPIGFVVLHFTRGVNAVRRVDLLFYRIRDYYRQMNLFERMLSTLAKELEAKGIGKPRVPLSKENTKRYSYVFEHHGFEVVPKISQEEGEKARVPLARAS